MKHAWLAELKKNLVPTSEPVPPGFVSVSDAAKELGMSINNMRAQLVKAYEMGLLDRITLKRFNGNYGKGSCLRNVFYYRWKKK